MDDLKVKAKIALIWVLFGKIAKLGMGFIISIFLARLLEPSDFGLFAMVMVIVMMADVFTDIGLGAALIQRRKLHKVHYSSVFYFNVFIGTILTIVTFFSANQISIFYDNDALVPITQAISFIFILSTFGSVQTIRLRKELHYKLLTKLTLSSSLISGIVGISMAFYGAGVWSLVVQGLLSKTLYTIFVWHSSTWRPGFIFSLKALMQLWAFGFRMFFVELLGAIVLRLDYIIIGKIFAATTLGFYQRGKSLNELVIRTAAEPLMTIMFPVLSKIQNDLSRMQNVIIKLSGIVIFVTFLIISNIYLVSEELIVLLFSDKWLPSVPYLQLLLMSGIFFPINILLINVLSSRGNSKAYLRMAILKKTLNVLNLYVGFQLGIEGFLYGLILVEFINTIISVLFVSREISLSYMLLLKPIIIQIVISLSAVLATIFLVQNMDFGNLLFIIIKSLIFTLIYLIINRLMKTSSYIYFIEEFIPLIKKKSSRLTD